jgi:pyridoxal phosphate enzyme (YggS family)
MSDPALPQRIAAVRQEIAARQRAGGWTHPVGIVAVTKGHGPEAVRAAAAAGLTMVGENRVQEALGKQEACGDVVVDWHLIGTLQRNKVRQIVGRFAMIHSVDRLELVQELARRTPTERVQELLVQVNCSGEPQKGGVEPEGLPALLDALRAFPSLRVRGLMTMAALDADEPALRRTFGRLRTLAEAGRSAGHDLAELSMGMSDDYPVAVEEGATMLRLGTILFGARNLAGA